MKHKLTEAEYQVLPVWSGAELPASRLRPLVIFSGGFGSGKTEVAVNFALSLVGEARRVAVVDLDIVNPYFRSRSVKEHLRARGVDVILPDEALLDADLPVVQPEVKGLISNPRGLVILDLGGDPVGARVLASLLDRSAQERLDAFFVFNSRRPRTRNAELAARMMQDIAAAAGISFTGIVVNSHLIGETTEAVIAEGIGMAEELVTRTGVPIVFVALEAPVLNTLDLAQCKYPLLIMERLMLKPWEPSNWLGRHRIEV